jgi:hypothetical protein
LLFDSAGAPVGGGIFQEKLSPKDNPDDVARTLFARSRHKQPDCFDQRNLSALRPGMNVPPLGVAEAFGGCALLRRSRRVGIPIEGRALYATDIRKANHGALTNGFFVVWLSLFRHFAIGASGVRSDQLVATFKGGYIMLKILTAAAASFAMLGAAAAADLPRREPPPPAPAPVGKYPVGKYPIGKYPPPAPVVTKG